MDALKSKGQMYDQIDLGKISRSGFDLSWNNKGTGKIGRIIPTRCTEVLPGDRFKGESACAVQFEPLAVPILANMSVRQEHFYVPNNIVWSNWDKFITGGQNLDDTSVLPSTSLYDILMALFNNKIIFPSAVIKPYWEDKDLATNADSDTSCTGYLAIWYSDRGDGILNYYGVCKSRLKAFGQQYGCMDLLAPQFEVLQKFYDLFEPLSASDLLGIPPAQYHYYAKGGKDLYGIPVATNLISKLGFLTPDSVSGSQQSFFWDKLEQSNTYVKDLIPTLKSIVSADTDSYVQFPHCVYTETGYQLFQLWYDFYSSFVGVGSNLDYLNCTRVSLKDVYLMLLLQYLFDKRSIPYYKTLSSSTIDYRYCYDGIGSFDEGKFSSEKFSILPLRANYAIWYNYYRDQLLETIPAEPSTSDIVTEAELIQLILPRQRCWAKDTFTTALSNPGTGSMIVPVDSSVIDRTTEFKINGLGEGNVEQLELFEYVLSDGTKLKLPSRFLSGLHDSETIAANMSGFSLDMLNRAQRAQKWLQKALIYGNRIQDRLFTSFGVKFLDNRLKLPEFLASSRELVQLSVNTNPTTIVTEQSSTVAGDKSANAFAYDKGGSFNRFCEEHGFILSYLTIMPEATYPYSVSRFYGKMDKFDYAWPEFSTIGMDSVYMKELCGSSLALAKSVGTEVFGYQGRYYDYKCHQDEEHGELQTTQNMYTFSREYDLLDDDKKPKLNYIFVHCWPSLDMFVVDSKLADYFRYDIHHSVAAERPLPVCGLYL